MIKRIAVSMPEPMYVEMERARGTAGQDRSAWVQQAIADRLKREQRAADIAAFIRGYIRMAGPAAGDASKIGCCRGPVLCRSLPSGRPSAKPVVENQDDTQFGMGEKAGIAPILRLAF